MKETLIINLIAKDMFVGIIYCNKIKIIDSTTVYIYSKSELVSSIEFKRIEKIKNNIYNLYIKIH